MFNRKLKERIKLLEYENRILSYKIREIEKQLSKPLKPMFPFPEMIKEGGGDLSYEALRKKYRTYNIIFENDL